MADIEEAGVEYYRRLLRILSRLTPQRLIHIEKILILDLETQDVIYTTTDDEVFAFGHNVFGTLPFGHNQPVMNPTIVHGLTYKRLEKIVWNPNGMVFGLTQSGQIYSWGCLLTEGNRRYWCATPIPTSLYIPESDKIIDISCGGKEALVLTESGALYRLQRSSGITLFVIFRVNSNEKFIAISSGFEHNLALTQSSHVLIWGHNTYGQLGLADTAVKCVTQFKPFHSFVGKISCGLNHSLVLTDRGRVHAFGDNTFGQLGTGDTVNPSDNRPVIVKDVDPFADIRFVDIFADSKTNISMGLSTERLVYVWGECRNGVVVRPLRTRFSTFQDVINHFCTKSFTHQFLNYEQLLIRRSSDEIVPDMEELVISEPYI